MINKTFITIIILLALFFRLYNINNLPPSLNWDEVSLGYNAYSVLHTGADEWGINLPLIFRAYGDFKLPLYIYMSVPFIAIFGLNALSIKLLSIVAGTISCLIFYLISRRLFPKSTIVPLIGLIIYAFSPWSIFLSRIALEANLFLCFFLISFYFLIDKKYWQSSLFYGLCLFTYNSSRIILFPYLLILMYLVFKHNSLKQHWYKYTFFIVAIIIFVFQSLDTSGQARYKWVSLIDEGAINQINELRQQYPRIIVNKYTFFTYKAVTNYLKHFSPEYIFFKGGSHYQFNIPNSPLISPFLLPFSIIGLISLVRQLLLKKDTNLALILLFTLIAPLPSAITKDAPQILRSIIFLPFITTIMLFGINFFKHKLIIIAYTLISVTLTLFSFWKTYPTYAHQYAQSWQYGYSQMVDYITANYDYYDQIVITKRYAEPHEFILFYGQYSPQRYQNDTNKKWDYHADWYWVDAFDKYKFINDWEVKDFVPEIGKQTLLITSPDNYNQSIFHHIQSINEPNEKKVFDITNNIK